MANIKKTNGSRPVSHAGRIAKKSEVLLKMLAPYLRERGVPNSSYVKVRIVNSEFGTGKTRQEVNRRFELMHPGANGWLRRFGDVVGELDDDATDVQRTKPGASPIKQNSAKNDRHAVS